MERSFYELKSVSIKGVWGGGAVEILTCYADLRTSVHEKTDLNRLLNVNEKKTNMLLPSHTCTVMTD